MTPVVKRRELTDPGQLQALVIDHVEGIEPGLAMLDSRLLLGQATIDIIGLDDHGALVLMAVGASADEEMLLKAVEAYSWCLEYPAAIRRLYPSVQISSARPPRLMFIVERMPDSFHRKIKQLGFPEVDCVEFRYLDIDGAPAVYFDTLARLRRGPAAPAPAPERVVPPAAPVTNGRPTSLKLQKLLAADRPAAAREPAQVVSLIHRAIPRAETPKPVVGTPKLESVITPRIEDESVADDPTSSALAVIDAVDLAPASITVPELDQVAATADTMKPVDQLTDAPELPAGPSAEADAVEPMVTPEPILEQMAVTVAPVTAPEPVVALPALDIAEVEPTELIAVNAMTTEPVADPVITTEPEATVATNALADAPVIGAEPEHTIEDVPAPAELLADAPVGPVAEIAAPMIQAVAPAPAPSVFARRAAEPAAKPPEPKVSFADAAKELLRSEPVDNLVGAAAEKPVTAFAKPGGAFTKPAAPKVPRTIAPPPADPSPIAAGPKLGAAPKRAATPAPVAKAEAAIVPEAAPASEPAAAQPASPRAFEGLQFPNDGVLTRQWMEFLNQMAAGK